LRAAGLASPRLGLLPTVTLGIAWLLGPGGLAQEVVILMNGTPVAVNLIVLSVRCQLFEGYVATLVLISTLGTILTMNLWVVIL
jgi:predicted permease